MGNCFDNKKVQPEFDGIQIKIVYSIDSCSVCDLNNLKIDFIENHPTTYKINEIRE